MSSWNQAQSINEGLPSKQDILIARYTESPLVFEQQIKNLKSLNEHLGSDAVNYSAEFETALEGIINQFLQNGGMYVQSVSNDVADSIRSMFRGEEGEFSVDDIKTMAALSFENDLRNLNSEPGARSLGTFIGSQINMIGMAHESGKLSSTALESVITTFNSLVENWLNRHESRLSFIINDPNSSNKIEYETPDKDDVMKAINDMFNAMRENRFNKNLNTATINILIELHNASVASRLAYIETNDENKKQFIDKDYEKDRFVGFITSSRQFSEFISQTPSKVNYNPLSMDTFA